MSAAAIPVDGLRSINLVVESARAAAEGLARVHGIGRWDVRRYDADSLTDASTRGFANASSYVVASGEAPTPAGPIAFTLIEPLDGWTTYHEFLNTRGPGIHSIRTAALVPAALADLRRSLPALGIAVAQRARLDGAVERVLFDTRAALGGFYIEIEASDGAALRTPDEMWELGGLVPSGGPVVPMRGVAHFGVVVTELMPHVERYATLFGVTDFTFRNWRRAPGSLDDPTYLGQPVDHAYFTTTVTAGPGVAFEVIQPTFGPTHYREAFLAQLGPGIHHLHAGMLDDRAAWPALEERAAANGIPMVMSGSILDRFLDFYYLDTRAAAGGYVTEFVVPGERFDRGRPSIPFAMTASLAARADEEDHR